MFKDLGIKGRVVMLTLLPSCLLALLLGGYFSWLHFQQLHAQLQQRGNLLAEQIARDTARPLQRQDLPRLQEIIQQALQQDDVRALRLSDPQRIPLLQAGPRLLPSQAPTQGWHRVATGNGEAWRLLLPILDQHLSTTPTRGEEQLLGWLELELSQEHALLLGYRHLLGALLFSLAALLGGTLLALRLGRAIEQPLQHIQQGVARLSEGHLDTRLPHLGSHDLDALASGINRMAESLQDAQEELYNSIEQATEDVRQNLETIEIQNIELDLARKEALETSRIKSEFLANMSHEIRTPLNAMLGFTQLLQKSSLTARQRDYLDTIEESTNNLLAIINGVLDISKIEAGRLILDNSPFNLRDLIQDCLTVFAPNAHAKHLELICLVYRDTPLHLLGDSLRLRQVLSNLISNAIKFTEHGDIVVRAMLEDLHDDRAQLRISVQDSGIGVTEQDQQQLFRAFSQADNSLTRQAGGSGLGLAISKQLIELMGGEIGLESVPGQGAEFWISLSLPLARADAEDLAGQLAGRRSIMLEAHPLAAQALQHQLEDCGLQVQLASSLADLLEQVGRAASSAEPIACAVIAARLAELPANQLARHVQQLRQLNCQTLVLCPTNEQASYQQQVDEQLPVLGKPLCTSKLQKTLAELLTGHTPGTQHGPLLPGITLDVLCVDDNPANLRLVKTLLEDLGVRVCAVEGGQQAVDACAQQHFDLIFMDVQMPGMDGRQATQLIRQQEQHSGRSPTPIVALTAHALHDEKRQLLQSGMDDYLSKPISTRQLSQTLLKWSSQHLTHSVVPTDQPLPNLSALPLFDAEEGLRLAAGKTMLAADMLDMLLGGLADDRTAIRQAREDNARELLLERVHRLHGATRYCGVPQLRQACQHCETLLKQNAPESGAALDTLDQAIAALLDNAGQLSSPHPA